MRNRKTLWITKTAIFIALLVTVQLGTAHLNIQMLTGSLVNLLLILSVMTSGYASGTAVALISPVTAFLIGHGLPTPLLLPFIMIGNLVFILLWRAIGNLPKGVPFINMTAAGVIASAVKFGVLYISIVKVAIPYILGLPPAAENAVSVAFSLLQLFTALIGSGIAIALLTTLRNSKALRSH